MTKDILYMRRALELASNGLGHVSPNPMVGCVIVCDDKIIGEGWHEQYGEAHAEVNAINNVKNTELLQQSTVYVTLEPCAHQGKTPPCADLLIKHNVKRVVIGATDPNPLVAGKGIEMMKAAGIDVVQGVLEEQCQEINRRFFTLLGKNRPYIILKWAQTADGFVARKNYDSKWISGELSRKLVHKWRAEEDAIMVATHTAKYDNPRLDVRDWSGKNPLRIVIDKKLELPDDLNIFDGIIPTVCYTLKKADDRKNVYFVNLDENNFMQDLLKDLARRNVGSVLIEGGAALHKDFIENYLWDEARVFISTTTFGGGIEAARISLPFKEEIISEDRLLVYRNKQSRAIQ